MDIKDLFERKAELKRQIGKLIIDFESKNGINLSSIHIDLDELRNFPDCTLDDVGVYVRVLI